MIRISYPQGMEYKYSASPVVATVQYPKMVTRRVSALRYGKSRLGRPNNPGEPRSHFKPHLQGLRAVAILLVVGGHSGVPYLTGGFVGVDVFFVLSGYLITGLLFREFAHSHRIEFISFYARRLRRLLPALVAMLSVTGLIALATLSAPEADMQLASVPYAATWTSNLYFAFSTIDYFDLSAERNVFLHTWSLAVEEQFYLVWPVMLTAVFAIAARQRLMEYRAMCMALLAVVFVASLALSLRWTVNTPLSAYYMMPSRGWQFALGAVVCLLPERVTGYRLISVGIVTGLALILVSASLLSGDVPYPGHWALVPSMGAALAIWAGDRGPSIGRDILSHPFLVWVGDRSYSWYLWHWPILMLGYALGFEKSPLVVLGLVLLSLLAAMVSYRTIELPFWKGRYRLAAPGRTLLVSVLAAVLTVAVLLQGARLNSDVSTVDSLRADLPEIYSIGCDTWYGNADVEPCVFGPEQAPKTVVLFGDSIGAQWFSAVPEIFPAPEWRTIVLTKSSCAIVDEDFFYKRIGRTYEVCTEWRNAAIGELSAFHPDVVIVGNHAQYDFTEAQWTEGSARVFQRLSEVAATVFVIVGTPRLGFNGPGCVARNRSMDDKISRNACVAAASPSSERVARYLNTAAQRFPRVHVLDFSDVVCPAGVCNAVSHEGLLVFRDTLHVTDTFVRAKVPVLRERFMATGALTNRRSN